MNNCDACGINPVKHKDYRSFDGTTSSVYVCNLCRNVDDETYLELQNRSGQELADYIATITPERPYNDDPIEYWNNQDTVAEVEVVL